ncbi:MAG: hypothetical protein V4722_24960 [Bacteroidota bacterium]
MRPSGSRIFNKCFFFTVSLLLSQLLLPAQKFNELVKDLPPETPFKRVQEVINGYFDKMPQKDKEYKQWKRFEWLAQRRLNDKGMLQDVVEWNKKAMAQRAQLATNAPNAVNALSNGWTALGPTGNDSTDGNLGRVVCIAFHPTNANTWYVGTPAGGLWRTRDGGTSYTPLSDTLPGLGVASICIHPTNPDIIYILTGDGNAMNRGHYLRERGTGVYKSTNGGTTWTETGMIWAYSSNTYGFKMLMQPGNPNLMLAATSSGIWRSIDAGVSWANTNNAIGFTDIEFKPGNSSVVFASGYSGSMYYSSDAGVTWGSRTLASGTDRMELEVTPANANRIYALCGPGTAGAFKGLFTYDGTNYAGGGWTIIRNFPNIFGYSDVGSDAVSQTWRNISLYVSAANENLLLTGGCFIWKSTNGGAGIAKSSGDPVIHADNHFIVKHPLSNFLLSGCDGGLFKSTDTGATWKSISKGLQVTQFYKFDASVTSFGQIIGGAQDNGHLRRKLNSSIYDFFAVGDGMDVLMDPTNNNIMYGCNQNGGFFKSTVTGDTMQYSATQPTPGDDYWVTNIALHNTVNTTLFFGGAGGIRRSTNSGASWTDIGGSGQDAMMQGTSNIDRLYAAQGITMRRTDNVNAATPTWTTITGTAPNYPPASVSFITGIAVDPDNSGEVWICVPGFVAGEKVYRSTNAGVSWTNMSLNLPNIPIHCILFEDNNNAPGGAIYVGTEMGVYYRDNVLGIWLPFGQYLPNSPVTDLKMVVFGGTKYLYASTFGRGMFYTMSYSQNGCIPYLSVSNSQYGNKLYAARDSLYTTATTTGASNAEITLNGGTYVRFGPGAVYSGNNGKFLASVAVCTSGGVPNPNTSAEMLGVEDAESFFAQTPVANANTPSLPAIVKQKEGQYAASFTSDGKHEIRVSIKDDNNETLGYFVRAFLEEGGYELSIPKIKMKKQLWLVIEKNEEVTRLKL